LGKLATTATMKTTAEIDMNVTKSTLKKSHSAEKQLYFIYKYNEKG
jgi:hypothetical protein